LLLYAATTLDRFIDECFQVLPRVVRCDYVSVFYQRAGDAFLRERDSRGRLWDGAFMRRYAELTPAIPLVAASPGIMVLATRTALALSGAALQQTPFYREVMRPQGWRHGACLCFWAEPVGSFPILVLTLYRQRRYPDFSDRELSLLQSIHPFVAPAVTRFHQYSALTAVSAGIALALQHVSRGIVILDWEFTVVQTNPPGRRSCAEWRRWLSTETRAAGTDPAPVPPSLIQACRELRHELTSAPRHHAETPLPRRRQVAHPEAPGLVASVSMLYASAGIAEPSFVIEFADPQGAAASAGHTAAALTSLTRSEFEVACVVSEGVSNEEAAERLGKTVHAVKFLLHSTYKKLHLDNRGQLTIILNGRTAAQS
jgi:DNA-binding CsgD family transcriptional regulator